MILSLCHYQLQIKGTKDFRSGFLLRYQNGEGDAFGYADIFPWAMFNDPDLGEIPDLLRKHRNLPPLLERSIHFAQRDAQARAQGISLLKGRKVNNHFSLPFFSDNNLQDAVDSLGKGFQRIKVKLGRQIDQEHYYLKELFPFLEDKTLRVDFNGRATGDYIEFLQNYSQSIEFIEDPFTDPELWQKGALEFAYDYPSFSRELVDCPWTIWKPAKQPIPETMADKSVFTSYLGHPVGQIHGMVTALEAGEQIHDYGFASHWAYETNRFSERLIEQGRELSAPDDVGIGFTDLLESLKWEVL